MEFYRVFKGEKLVGNAYVLRGQSIEEAHLVPSVLLDSQHGHGSHGPSASSGAFESNKFLMIGQKMEEGRLIAADQGEENRLWEGDKGKGVTEDNPDPVSCRIKLEEFGNNDVEKEDKMSEGTGDSETVSNVKNEFVQGNSDSVGWNCAESGDQPDLSLLLAPFNKGWQREVVTGKNKQVLVVYYLPPVKRGKRPRVRTWKGLSKVLVGSKGLTLDNFSFDKVLLGLGPDREIVRESSKDSYDSEIASLLEPIKDSGAVESLPHPATTRRFWQYFKVLKPGSKRGRLLCLLCGDLRVVSSGNMTRHVYVNHPHHRSHVYVNHPYHQSEARNMGLDVTKNYPLSQSDAGKLSDQVSMFNPLHQSEIRNIGHQNYSPSYSDPRKLSGTMTKKHQSDIRNSMGQHVPRNNNPLYQSQVSKLPVEANENPRNLRNNLARHHPLHLDKVTNMSGHVAKNSPLRQPGQDKINIVASPMYTMLQGHLSRENGEAALNIVGKYSETGTEENPFVEDGAAHKNPSFSVETDEKLSREQAIPDVVSGNISMESFVSNSENTRESNCDSSVHVDKNNMKGRRRVTVTFIMKDNSNRLRMEVKSKVKLMKLMVMFVKRFSLHLGELRFINGNLGTKELELSGEEKVEDLKTGLVMVERLYIQ